MTEPQIKFVCHIRFHDEYKVLIDGVWHKALAAFSKEYHDSASINLAEFDTAVESGFGYLVLFKEQCVIVRIADVLDLINRKRQFPRGRRHQYVVLDRDEITQRSESEESDNNEVLNDPYRVPFSEPEFPDIRLGIALGRRLLNSKITTLLSACEDADVKCLVINIADKEFMVIPQNDKERS